MSNLFFFVFNNLLCWWVVKDIFDMFLDIEVEEGDNFLEKVVIVFINYFKLRKSVVFEEY